MRKIRFNKGVGDNQISYPISQQQIDKLKNSDLVNPFEANNARVYYHPNEVPPPIYPEDDGFYEKLLNVAEAVHYTKRGYKFNSTFKNVFNKFQASGIEGDYLAETIKREYNITKAKELGYLVQNDFPTKLITDLVIWLKDVGGAKIRKDLFPKRGYKVFTDGQVMVGHLIGWVIHTVSPTAFAHKYYWGMPRPEEVLGAWARGEYEVPTNIGRELNSYVDKASIIKDERNFTLYTGEGSPTHPSDPAMHSAVAAIGLICSIIFDLTPELENECKKVSSNIAFGRTFAGVHYCEDNIRGLNMGEEVVAKILPDWLAQWDANKAAVKELCLTKRTNWKLNK